MIWLKRLVLILCAVLPAPAGDHRLLICGAASKGYVVGMKLPASGLFALTGSGEWEQRGFNHPYITALDYDRRDPHVIYIAAGNGCIRSQDSGRTWRIITSWDVTELQDIAVDVLHPGTLFIALPDGIARSNDEGRTWKRAQDGIERKFTKAIRVDREAGGHVVAGTERGIFQSADNGGHWTRVEATGEMITAIEQSPHRAGDWLATSQRSGLLRSMDGGRSWSKVRAVPDNRTLYSVSYDPRDAKRIAVCGWGLGVLISQDGGATFSARNSGLPSTAVWSVRFDPDHDGRIYAGVHEEGVFVSDDAGRHWRPFGMEGAIVNNMMFVPEAAR